MDKFIKLNLIVGAIFIFASWAAMSPISPTQVSSTLPTLTKSKFTSQSEAEEAIKTNRCKYLVKERNYSAPLGLTVKADLQNGA